ncbi:MAG: hypothetical protein IJS88_01795 [Alphaproteobacteria bacterium]|nr:hypothetical protein [Alphaproteobacteria bacterium]
MKKLFFIVSLMFIANYSFAVSADEFEWSKIVSVTETVSLNQNEDGFITVRSVRFDNGYVMPVTVENGIEVYHPDAAEPDEGQGFNSALYSVSEGRWVNAVASEKSEEYENGMSWEAHTGEKIEVSAEFALSKGVFRVKR